MPLVATADIAARAASLLLDPSWAGHHTIGLVQIDSEQVRRSMLALGLPDFVAAAYAELYQGVRDGRMDAAEPRTPETTTPTTLREFVRTKLLPALRAAAPASVSVAAPISARAA